MTTHRPCSRTDALRAASVDPLGPSEAQREHAASCADCQDVLWLSGQMAELASEPIGRGTDAESIWARAEVLRRLDIDPSGTPRSSSVALGPVVGALIAIVGVLWLMRHMPWAAIGVEAAPGALWLAVGSLIVLAMATVASVALVWDEL